MSAPINHDMIYQLAKAGAALCTAAAVLDQAAQSLADSGANGLARSCRELAEHARKVAGQ